MNDFLRNRLGPSKVAGLHVRLNGENPQMDAAVVKKENTTIEKDATHSGLQDSKQLREVLDTSLPICLSVDGKGVLHKTINASEAGPNPKIDKLIQLILPNAKASDFFHQIVKEDENEYIVSIIRKEALYQLNDDLNTRGFVVVQVSLGPFAARLLEQEEEEEEEVQKEENPAAGQVAYANAFQYFLPQTLKIAIKENEFTEYDDEFIQKRIFTAMGWAGLVVFLGVLLINYFTFSALDVRNQELSHSVENYQDQLNYLEALEKRTQQREQFLQGAGWLSPDSKTSFYADRIAATVPREIRLSVLNIFPREKNKNRSEKRKWLYDGARIAISGNSNRSTSVNEWMKQLENLAWVKKVELVNYTQKALRDRGEFEIHIMIG